MWVGGVLIKVVAPPVRGVLLLRRNGARSWRKKGSDRSFLKSTPVEDYLKSRNLNGFSSVFSDTRGFTESDDGNEVVQLCLSLLQCYGNCYINGITNTPHFSNDFGAEIT